MRIVAALLIALALAGCTTTAQKVEDADRWGIKEIDGATCVLYTSPRGYPAMDCHWR